MSVLHGRQMQSESMFSFAAAVETIVLNFLGQEKVLAAIKRFHSWDFRLILFVCLSVCLSCLILSCLVCLSVCLSVFLCLLLNNNHCMVIKYIWTLNMVPSTLDMVPLTLDKIPSTLNPRQKDTLTLL